MIPAVADRRQFKNLSEQEVLARAVLSSCKKSADQGSFWSSIVGAIIGF